MRHVLMVEKGLKIIFCLVDEKRFSESDPNEREFTEKESKKPLIVLENENESSLNQTVQQPNVQIKWINHPTKLLSKLRVKTALKKIKNEQEDN
ncbi:hypothetical protein BpHYR1_040185 [Brachionus plicatilis]|uniref:Uncharacterized protein n=1 Tax=Brachionus plicatilis TaxID=10195 RepID=A0A3M7QI97_BRAPC|nr:hypothetical protein BpHYR1_040185 [Brachionus plicatilis]